MVFQKLFHLIVEAAASIFFGTEEKNYNLWIFANVFVDCP